MARSSMKSGAPPASSREAFFFKTQLCTFHLRGICAKGSACNFAHSDSEHRTCPNLAKTCLCQDWMNGSCALMAAECKFAHGGDDMRYTSLAALRGPPGTKVPLPSFIYKNWPTNTLHPARFERDGNVFMEKEPSKKHITNLTDSVPNQTQAVAAAERITTTVSTYLPQVSTSDRTYESEKKATVDSMCSLQISTMDSMHDLGAGSSILAVNTMDSMYAFQAGSCISTVESLPDILKSLRSKGARSD